MGPLHKKHSSRPYRGANSTQATTRHIRQLLPNLLHQIGKIFHERPDLVIAGWPDVIGPHLAPMTEALFFQEGVLTVKVKNSTLYSLLNQDKSRIVKNLREKFPNTLIKTVYFRLG